jgi:hypothetical protein
VIHRQVSFAHNSFIFNEHLDSSGVSDPSKEADTYLLTAVRPVPSFRSQRDVYHLAEGGSPGEVHAGLKMLSLSGLVKVGPTDSQLADLEDHTRALLAAFDPRLCYRDSPSTNGVYALDYYARTKDTTNYATGWIPLRMYVRPEGAVECPITVDDQFSRPFGITVVAFDPRVYEQSEITSSHTPAATTKDLINLGDAPSPLKATITMAGAGASNFTITRSGVSFILDLSGCSAADVVTVVMEECAPYGMRKITKGAVEAAALRTSAPSTYLDVPKGTTSFAIANHTNVTTCVLAFRPARA